VRRPRLLRRASHTLRRKPPKPGRLTQNSRQAARISDPRLQIQRRMTRISGQTLQTSRPPRSIRRRRPLTVGCAPRTFPPHEWLYDRARSAPLPAGLTPAPEKTHSQRSVHALGAAEDLEIGFAERQGSSMRSCTESAWTAFRSRATAKRPENRRILCYAFSSSLTTEGNDGHAEQAVKNDRISNAGLMTGPGEVPHPRHPASAGSRPTRHHPGHSSFASLSVP